MIISQSPKVIFIHIPRTGGTSIRQLFNFPLVGHQCHATTLKRSMSDEEWASYFKFTIVRNPWERSVSMYFYAKTVDGLVEPGESFSDWIIRRYGPQTSAYRNRFYSIWFRDEKDALLVDEIYRYENYETDIRGLVDRFELMPQGMPLPHMLKTEKEHYSTYYTAAAKDLVSDLYAEDIKFFQYEF